MAPQPLAATFFALMLGLLPITAGAQIVPDVLEAIKIGHHYALRQPKLQPGTLSPAQQSQALQDLAARYKPSTVTVGFERSLPPDYAAGMQGMAQARPKPVVPDVATQSAWLDDAASQMRKRPVHPAADTSFMASSAFEQMKRNVEAQRAK